jgi:amino acid transporter
MNLNTLRPLPLLVVSVVLGILLISLIIFFGASATTRGPIEILLALLIGALVLFFRALARRAK